MDLSPTDGLCDGHDPAVTNGGSLPDANAQNYFSLALHADDGLKTAAFSFDNPEDVYGKKRGYICEVDGKAMRLDVISNNLIVTLL